MLQRPMLRDTGKAAIKQKTKPIDEKRLFHVGYKNESKFVR